MAKVIGSETYHGLADDALQVYGGNGYSEEYPAARWYRDSRITRIYEGTSEICRLSIAKTILTRSARGRLALREALAGLTPPTAVPAGSDLEAFRNGVGRLKQLFLFVIGHVWEHIDADELLAPHQQQYLGSLADIAIEIYRAESTTLRVEKLTLTRPTADVDFQSALATLVFHVAADRVRQEATEVLAALLDTPQRADALQRMVTYLPTPVGLLDTRTAVARELVARHGELS
jgi:hypothetical protein